MKYSILTSLLLGILLVSCNSGEQNSDAYGNFEAEEILVSSEMSGKLMSLNAEEGEWLEEGQLVGYVDTMHLHLQKQQFLAQIDAVLSRSQDVPSQIAVYDKQLENLERELKRAQNLAKGDAATAKQVDDLEGQIDVVQKQKDAHLIRLKSSNRSVSREIKPLQVQIQLIDLQIQKSLIKSPLKGQVLDAYAEAHEVTSPGRPLFKLANTREMQLQAFVSGDQLSQIQLGSPVTVLFDNGNESLESVEGRISWIASKAEFTPKTIQTREERTDLVYACKIVVNNQDGKIKIGMPGEARFESMSTANQSE